MDRHGYSAAWQRPSLSKPGGFFHEAGIARLAMCCISGWVLEAATPPWTTPKSIVSNGNDEYQMAWIEVICRPLITHCADRTIPMLGTAALRVGSIDQSPDAHHCTSNDVLGRRMLAQHHSKLANKSGRRSSRETNRFSGVSALPAVPLFGFRQLIRGRLVAIVRRRVLGLSAGLPQFRPVHPLGSATLS